MCSTTRAALLTGRNHHSVGMGCLANFDSGYPGYRGKIAREAGTLAEMLRPHGYRNYMIGKWHVTPVFETGPTGPFDGWPLARGFDRYYGFMDAETDQYAPELVLDNTHIDPPGTYETGYHLTPDLIDQSIRFIADHIAGAPQAPWLTWIALGACHAPHQAPRDLILKYDALFQHGWDAERERRLARQIEMGVVPAGTKLPPRNDGVVAWDTLSADERQVFCRLQGAYAAMLDHADQHIARLMAFLETSGQADNTLVLVLSDNGASQEGFIWGMVNAMAPYNAIAEPMPVKLARIDDIGGPNSHSNFPVGLGDGVQHAAQALQAEHPRRRHPRSAGAELAEGPARARRAAPPVLPRQRPHPDAARHHRHRRRPRPSTACRRCRWRARASPPACATRPPRRARARSISRCSAIAACGTRAGRPSRSIRPARRSRATGGSFITSTRTSRNRRTSPSRSPQRLQAMIARWWQEAERCQVLPLDDRFGPRFAENAARVQGHRRQFVFHAGMGHVPTDVAPDLRSRSYRIEADVEVPGEGVLIAHGDMTSGYSLYVQDGHLVHDFNIGATHQIVRSGRQGAKPQVPARLPHGARREQGHRHAADRRRAVRRDEDQRHVSRADLLVRPRHRARPRQPRLALRRPQRLHGQDQQGHRHYR